MTTILTLSNSLAMIGMLILYFLDIGNNVRLYVKPNNVELRDEIFDFGYSSTNKQRFYSVENTIVDLQAENIATQQLLYCIFHIDPQTDSYDRSVYTFLDLTGQVGGFYEILEILGSFFVGIFAEKLLSLSLISNLYTYRTNPDSDSLNKTTPKINDSNANILENEEMKRPSNQISYKPTLRTRRGHRLKGHLRDDEIQAPSQDKKLKESSKINQSLAHAMLGRKRLKYSCYDYILSFSCIKCTMKQKYLHKGESRILEDFDCI